MKLVGLIRGFAAAGAASLVLAGCHTDMWVQPRTKTYDRSTFYADGRSARVPVAGTVAQGQLKADDAFTTGFVAGKLVTELPVPLTKALLERGRERFTIFCSPCHGQLGDGNGMIAQRGFNLRKKPASYHTDRLRKMPIGHFFDVISSGYGVMYSYAARVKPEDRWAIAAYIRALQASQDSSVKVVPASAGAGMPMPTRAPAGPMPAPAGARTQMGGEVR